MINIILCGGNGSRLWPISRKLFPKQFCKLIDEYSLFQKTVQRNITVCNSYIVVTNEEQYFLAVDQLEEINIKTAKLLLEPVGRNTAPAIALACFDVDPDEIVLVTPSDHLISDTAKYELIISQGEIFARQDNLVTFGIKPDYPETGFGYIEFQGNNVISFKEKPDFEIASQYIQNGNFYWNSGMFIFKAGVYLEELKKYAPDIYRTSYEAYTKGVKGKPSRIKLEDMMRISSISIDYAVMEKSKNIKVIPCDINWSDLGSFESLYKTLPKDHDGNALINKNVSKNSNNNLIISGDRLISTIDVDDLIIADTPDALLISKKGSSHKVKDIFDKLEEQNPDITNIHLTAHRPWGRYTILEQAYRFKIKKVVVKPGGKLSLQKHYHRNEHWIVVNGTAHVTIGEGTFILRANESTYIPMGEIHRLENPGKIELVIIEIQVGDYLGEDDIIRIEDVYDRSK